MFRRVLIAARGEIAMRILRSCRELGIETVLVYAKEDAGEMPVQFSHYPVCIGEGGAAGSYLRWQNILQTAIAYECEAIHPGYGFLSENAVFAEACEQAGITAHFEDYRPYYDEATRISRELGMYRQNYCGCRFSIAEGEATRAFIKQQRKAAKEAKRAAREAEETARKEKAAEKQAYAEAQAKKRAILKAMREES